MTELYIAYSIFHCCNTIKCSSFSVVPSESIQKATNFLTISSHGVTQYYQNDIVFTPLDVWEREYDYYCKLIKVCSVLKNDASRCK